MKSAFLLLPIVLTSLAAYVAGRRILGLDRGAVGTAALRMLECLGASAVFFVLDLVFGSVIVLAIRTLTPYFMPLYVMADTTLIPLALFQGVAFRWWMRLAQREGDASRLGLQTKDSL